jgi:hypothetical protein
MFVVTSAIPKAVRTALAGRRNPETACVISAWRINERLLHQRLEQVAILYNQCF